MQSKVIIIGGGPVGQTFAILLNQKVPSLDITIIELRKHFSRSQVMLLNKTSIDLLPKMIIKTLIDGQGCYVDPPPFDRRGSCYKFPKTSLIGISLSVLETELYYDSNHN
jgi:flavin-dependent dehydrogenase